MRIRGKFAFFSCTLFSSAFVSSLKVVFISQLSRTKNYMLPVEVHIVSKRSLRSRSVPELQCTQEDADTKMFLCASFAGDLGFPADNIVTVDSDVGILALYYQSKLDVSTYLEMGTSSKILIHRNREE